MDKILIAYAPYLSALLAVVVSFLSYKESRHKTRHDELQDAYNRIEHDNDRLRMENDRLRAELRKADKKHKQ